MKTYIGTNVVIKATPAIRKNGNIYLPEDTIPRTLSRVKEGYKIIFEDGRESWSPKDVFENTYRVANTAEDGLIIERNELFDKLTKLDRFINSKAFDKMTIGECSLCKAQFQAMNSYYTILCARVAAIND